MGQTYEIFPTKIYSDFLDRRITDEELLTVRFSGDIDPPKSAETSAE